MKTSIALLCLAWTIAAHAADSSTDVQVARLWYAAFNTKDAAIIDRIVDDRWVDIPSPPGTLPGPQALRKTFAAFTTAFPDLHLEIEDVIQDGSKVVIRTTMTGTQAKDFFGVASRGRRLSIQAVDIHEIRDGKIVRTWHTEDWMTGLRQLGVTGP